MTVLSVPELVVERVAGVVGGRVADNSLAVPASAIAATGFRTRRVAKDGDTLLSLSLAAARRALDGVEASTLGGIVCATFSNESRFPALSVRLASALGLPPDAPTIDLQLACSAYPYALYVAGRLAGDTRRRVLVVDGDLQSPLCDPADAATAPLFSDAATASVVSADPSCGEVSRFAFLSKASEALACPAVGPIRMDGFKVFSFVATDVVRMLREFGDGFDLFVPHQANMYMVRQMAKSLGLESKLVTCGAEYANPGSCSIPLALAVHGRASHALVAGFGAGLSAAAGIVRVAADAAAGIDDAS